MKLYRYQKPSDILGSLACLQFSTLGSVRDLSLALSTSEAELPKVGSPACSVVVEPKSSRMRIFIEYSTGCSESPAQERRAPFIRPEYEVPSYLPVTVVAATDGVPWY
jgi:hypothetical protein